MTPYRAAVTISTLFVLMAHNVRAQFPDGTPPPCASSPPSLTTIAVLDFANLSGDTAATYIVDGLADEIATRLGQLRRLTVTSRAAVRHLPNTATMSVLNIGRALSVAYLLTGSVRRGGDRLRVSVELLRARTGVQVWTEQFDRSDADLLSIEADIATAVASAIAGHLLPRERTALSASPTRNPEAYDAYLRGPALRGSGTAETDRRAVEMLERAIELDSTFALAWACDRCGLR